MKLMKEFWNDDRGAVLSAEVVTVGTIAVLGCVTGLTVAANAVDGELTDFAHAIRSLDQSYSVAGHRSCGAWTAGSCFTQRPVAESIQELCAEPTTPTVIEKKTEESPTPVIIPDTDPPKANQLPEPAKKGAKKKAKAKQDDDDDRGEATRPPQSRSAQDADA